MDNQRNVIIISTADWDNPFWTNKQHVAKTLSELGHKVVYFDSLGLRNPSKESSKDLKRIVSRLMSFFRGPRRINQNLLVFSPLVIPKHSNKLIAKLNNFLMSLYLKYFELTFFKGKILYWTYNPLSGDFLKSEDIIYHCVDDLTAAPGLPVERIQIEQQNLLKKSRIVFVTSKTLKNKFDELGFKDKVHYFPNVVDQKHFSSARNVIEKPQDLINLKGPVLGFIGAISSYKVDFELIRFIAISRPECSIVLIGQIGEGQPDTQIGILEGLPNVHLLGPKIYKDLPNYLKFFDVALLPCVINDYTRSMFPMKFFEYLSAGNKVVSTELDSLDEYRDCCYIARSHSDFLEGVDKALRVTSGEFCNLERIERLVRDNTWEERTIKMLKLIG